MGAARKVRRAKRKPTPGQARELIAERRAAASAMARELMRGMEPRPAGRINWPFQLLTDDLTDE